jgi:competence protein ComEA
MGGEKAFLTLVLVALVLLCLGILGARWIVLARRVPLEPLQVPGAAYGDKHAAAQDANSNDTPADAGAGKTKQQSSADEKMSTSTSLPANAAGLAGNQPQTDASERKTTSKAGSGVKLELNSATAAQLETLPGIGPALAKRIVDYRKQHGPFAKVEELLDVEGIGEGKLADIKGLVYVKPAA